jgi:transposase
MSQRQIAKKMRISRNTVKKYCDGNAVPWNRKEHIRAPMVVTEEVTQFIQNCFDEDEREGTSKQRHTAKRIYDQLVAELAFTGGESTIRHMVRTMNEQHKEVFVPLEFSPGEAMQVDWGEAVVYIGGIKHKVNLFCAPIVFAYERQNAESFLDAFVKTFMYFGGVARRVFFDNAKVAVKEGFGAHAMKQAGYAALSAHYGFEAVFCNPASGNEKGLVEGLVGWARVSDKLYLTVAARHPWPRTT